MACQFFAQGSSKLHTATRNDDNFFFKRVCRLSYFCHFYVSRRCEFPALREPAIAYRRRVDGSVSDKLSLSAPQASIARYAMSPCVGGAAFVALMILRALASRY